MTSPTQPSKFQKVSLLLFSLLAVVIIADFAIPGKTINDTVAGYSSTTESHNNAGGGSYLSYGIVTEAGDDFYASEVFARSVKPGDAIQLKRSRIFGQVNAAQIVTGSQKETHSLRIASGLIQPLLALLVIGLAFRFPDKFGTLLFVFQVMLLGNLIYLLY